ncbi:MAG: cytochrome P450 [Deltaproteobacteria bacterium]|nr:cytochrome P450 [Deltaproteobacteria bacterium]
MADRPGVDREFAFDPNDAAKAKDFARMALIRKEKPVCRPADNIVLVTRFDDVTAVFRDSKGFSSVGDMRAPGIVVPSEESFLGELDAPLHPKIRRVLHRTFTIAKAQESEPFTRQAIRRRLERIVAAGQGDLMAEFATPIPGSVSADLLGFPESQHDALMGWCNDLLHSSWPPTGKTEKGEGIAAGFPELAACIDEQIERRARDGSLDDLLASMVRSRGEDGWSIGAHHTRTLVVNMLAGSLSATYMVGNLLYRLITSRDFETALRRDPANIDRAVEESLRYEAPVAFLWRTARADSQIGSTPVFKGEHIMCHITAGNRDPEAYPDPETFRLDRIDPPEHLAFGSGPHLCLGNHLTRLIGRVVLEEALAVMAKTKLELAPDYVWHCVNHLQEYGPEQLPVRIAR